MKAAKYVRLADNTTIASVKEFIVEHWGLLRPRPHLVLSIVGGAKNFHMDGRKKETFKAGLIGAARATNAWVLSGGTNTGVMKLVGEELEEEEEEEEGCSLGGRSCEGRPVPGVRRPEDAPWPEGRGHLLLGIHTRRRHSSQRQEGRVPQGQVRGNGFLFIYCKLMQVQFKH